MRTLFANPADVLTVLGLCLGGTWSAGLSDPRLQASCCLYHSSPALFSLSYVVFAQLLPVEAEFQESLL